MLRNELTICNDWAADDGLGVALVDVLGLADENRPSRLGVDVGVGVGTGVPLKEPL